MNASRLAELSVHGLHLPLLDPGRDEIGKPSAPPISKNRKFGGVTDTISRGYDARFGRSRPVASISAPVI
jgi:hypothetical protein